MAKEKRPFHEVVSRLLLMAPVGISGDQRKIRAAEVMMLLSVLYKSIMPAEEAHKIAKSFDYFPELFRKVGHRDLGNFAEEVLADLAARKDEPKPESEEVVGGDQRQRA